jgi:hypothetical protein
VTEQIGPGNQPRPKRRDGISGRRQDVLEGIVRLSYGLWSRLRNSNRSPSYLDSWNSPVSTSFQYVALLFGQEGHTGPGYITVRSSLIVFLLTFSHLEPEMFVKEKYALC